MSRASKPCFDPADIRGLARLISRVESREAQAIAQLKAIHAARGGARVLGITGPPGAGKSTLVDQCIRHLRGLGQRVAIIAIDPSSPFSGGAVLGDRIRMQSHANDDGVFIRSVGSRGARGGLSRSTRAIVEICDAYRYDWVIIETVGVGQSEFDIMELADTTIVVLTPESGDTVQTLKAGLLEIADIFVVNKADREGADNMAQALSAMVQLPAAAIQAMHEQHDQAHRMQSPTAAPIAGAAEYWLTPVVLTTATQSRGIDELMQHLDRHAAFLAAHPQARARKVSARQRDFLTLCAEMILDQLQTRAATDAAMQTLLRAVGDGSANPYEAAEKFLERIPSLSF